MDNQKFTTFVKIVVIKRVKLRKKYNLGLHHWQLHITRVLTLLHNNSRNNLSIQAYVHEFFS
jgi:hypothetical protein